MRNVLQFCLFITLCWILISGCQNLGNYEKRITIPNHKWEKNFVPSFEFEKKSDKNQNSRLFVVVRHTNNYAYNNVHLKINISNGNDTAKSVEIDLPLTASNENKKWTNKGMDDIYEVKYPVASVANPGKYKVTVENIMRDNPLPEILNIGMAVENVVNQ